MRNLMVGGVFLVASLLANSLLAQTNGKPVEIKTAYGTYFDTYQSGSIEAKHSVVIIHDRWGLDKLALTWADRFAAQGYLALAIDLYDGRVADKDDDEHATELMRQMAPEWIDANLKAALAYLAKDGRKISVVGIGYGGSAAMRAAIVEPKAVTSTVNILGRLPSDVEQMRKIQGPVMVMHAAGENWVSRDDAENFEALMLKLQGSVQMIKMDGKLGVVDPEHDGYRKDESERAWQRTFEFVADSQ